MRCFKDNTGAGFDVSAVDAQRVEDIFDHETSGKVTDFKVVRATELPELKEDGGFARTTGGNQSWGGQQQQGYGGGYRNNSYGGQQSQSYGQQQSYGA